MSKFIEVTLLNGKKQLINTSTISSVWSTDGDSTSTIYFISPSTTNILSMEVQENYSHFKSILTAQ